MKQERRPKPDYQSPNPWLAFDERDEYEDCIAGNRKGLEALRSAIDQALEEKQSSIDFHFSHVRGVVLVEGDPRDTAKIRKNTWRDWLAATGSLLLLILFVLGSIFVVGITFKFIKRLINDF